MKLPPFRYKTSYSKPTVSKIGKKIALMQCIMHRDNFTDADIESLARGFGHSEDDVRAMVAEELARREARRGAA